MKRSDHFFPIRCLPALLGVLLMLCACAAPSQIHQPEPNVDLVWPAAPLPPRIQWVSQISSYRDAGLNRGFWQQLWGLISGDEQGRMIRPHGVFKDASQRLLVVDAGDRTVHLMDLAEKRYQLLGHAEPASFVTPIGVTAVADQLYLTDSSAGKIYRYGLADGKLGEFSQFKLLRPTGIAYSKARNLLYVVDTAAHQVVAFNRAGVEFFRFGSRGDLPGQFNYPTDLAITADGRIIVNDSLNARIQIFSPEGLYQSGFGEAGDAPGWLTRAKGVAVDSDGHIYICDAGQDSIQVFSQAGELLLSFGSNGSRPGEFWLPAGIFIDADDTIYVADSYNQRLQMFQYLKNTESNHANR